jgi:hypothetical protein
MIPNPNAAPHCSAMTPEGTSTTESMPPRLVGTPQGACGCAPEGHQEDHYNLNCTGTTLETTEPHRQNAPEAQTHQGWELTVLAQQLGDSTDHELAAVTTSLSSIQVQ